MGVRNGVVWIGRAAFAIVCSLFLLTCVFTCLWCTMVFVGTVVVTVGSDLGNVGMLNAMLTLFTATLVRIRVMNARTRRRGRVP